MGIMIHHNLTNSPVHVFMDDEYTYDGRDYSFLNLTYARLAGQNLSYSNFKESNLRFSNLRNSNLSGCDLTNARLSHSRLDGANFTDAILTGTCLDPEAPIDGLSYVQLKECGFYLDDDGYAYGYRSRESIYTRNPLNSEYEIYEPKTTYKAPWFSRDVNSKCHPGLYLCPTRSQALKYSSKIMLVRAKIGTIIKAGDKFRCPEFEALAYVDSDGKFIVEE